MLSPVLNQLMLQAHCVCVCALKLQLMNLMYSYYITIYSSYVGLWFLMYLLYVIMRLPCSSFWLFTYLPLLIDYDHVCAGAWWCALRLQAPYLVITQNSQSVPNMELMCIMLCVLCVLTRCPPDKLELVHSGFSLCPVSKIGTSERPAWPFQSSVIWESGSTSLREGRASAVGG